MRKELLAVSGVVAAIAGAAGVCPPARADAQMDAEIQKWHDTPAQELSPKMRAFVEKNLKEKGESTDLKATKEKIRSYPGGSVTVMRTTDGFRSCGRGKPVRYSGVRYPGVQAIWEFSRRSSRSCSRCSYGSENSADSRCAATGTGTSTPAAHGCRCRVTDIVDRKTRSRFMAGIRGVNTKPERQLRSALHKAGFRFRIHARLPGRPDILLPKYRAAVFVHGCFWHRHECHLFRWPTTRRGFWRQKLSGNAIAAISPASRIQIANEEDVISSNTKAAAAVEAGVGAYVAPWNETDPALPPSKREDASIRTKI